MCALSPLSDLGICGLLKEMTIGSMSLVEFLQSRRNCKIWASATEYSKRHLIEMTGEGLFRQLWSPRIRKDTTPKTLETISTRHQS